MRDRYFIAAVVVVAALAAAMLAENIRKAAEPAFGPPNVDKAKVMSMVESGTLSFEEARFYSTEETGESPEAPAAREEAR